MRRGLAQAWGHAHAFHRAQRELGASRGIPVSRVRTDAWMNGRTGIGTDADKTVHGFYAPVRRITDVELTDIYNGSALGAKIVEKPAREMFRRGYEIECDDVDASATKDLREHAQETFHLDQEFQRAKTFSDLFGGGLSILGVDDGNMPDEALDESRIRSFSFINYVDRRFAYVLDYYNDPTNLGNYGRPRHYLVSNAVAGFNYGPDDRGIGKVPADELRRRGYGTTIVHESRVIRWEGVATDYVTMQTLAGWTWSKLQRLYPAMRAFEHAFDSAMALLADASQGVYTLQHLFQTISSGGGALLRQRLALMEELRSVMHGIILGKDETFQRVPTPFNGIPDLLDKAMLRFCADVDMPVTEVFGQAPAGLNATGESDRIKWYDRLASEQPTELEPRFKRVYRLFAMSPDCPVKLGGKAKAADALKWTFKFKPLYTPTDKEQAETDLAIAQRDEIMMTEGVVTPEEVALDRAEWYPSMDVEAREKAMKATQSFDPYENDPEPTDTELPGGEQPTPNVGIPPPGTEPLDPSGKKKAAMVAPAKKPPAPGGKKKAPAKPTTPKAG